MYGFWELYKNRNGAFPLTHYRGRWSYFPLWFSVWNFRKTDHFCWNMVTFNFSYACCENFKSKPEVHGSYKCFVGNRMYFMLFSSIFLLSFAVRNDKKWSNFDYFCKEEFLQDKRMLQFSLRSDSGCKKINCLYNFNLSKKLWFSEQNLLT